jgi:hypothetical protein
MALLLGRDCEREGSDEVRGERSRRGMMILAGRVICVSGLQAKGLARLLLPAGGRC